MEFVSDAWHIVFTYLSPYDLLRLSNSCRFFKVLLTSRSMENAWKEACLRAKIDALMNVSMKLANEVFSYRNRFVQYCIKSQFLLFEPSKTPCKRSLKIALVGDPCVGKTQLRNVLKGLECGSYYSSSLGLECSFLYKKFKGECIRLTFLDSAGTPRATYPPIRFADAVIAMFDVTSRESFESMKVYWLEDTVKRDNNLKVPTIILANKVDEDRRQVSSKEVEVLRCYLALLTIKEFCRLYDSGTGLTHFGLNRATYFEISLKEHYNVFSAIADIVYKAYIFTSPPQSRYLEVFKALGTEGASSDKKKKPDKSGNCCVHQ